MDKEIESLEADSKRYLSDISAQTEISADKLIGKPQEEDISIFLDTSSTEFVIKFEQGGKLLGRFSLKIKDEGFIVNWISDHPKETEFLF